MLELSKQCKALDSMQLILDSYLGAHWASKRLERYLLFVKKSGCPSSPKPVKWIHVKQQVNNLQLAMQWCAHQQK